MNDMSNDPSDRAGSNYYAQAASWAEDKRFNELRWRRLGWALAIVAAAIAGLEAIALVALTPLKTVVPYTLLVDRNTGFAQALKGDRPPELQPNDALTQSLLAQYVIAREGFDISALQVNYRKVALWSAEDALRQYLDLLPAANPQSPLSRYPRTSIVDARIESITPVGPKAALVRFYTERTDQGQLAGPRSYWVALLRYRFTGEPMSIDDRIINPLGFQVLRYRIDQEAPPAPAQPRSPSQEPPSAAAAAAVGPAPTRPEADAPPSSGPVVAPAARAGKGTPAQP